MLDHPRQFSKKFIASLFNSPESNLNGFDFLPVGSGQVGDCFRVNLDWKEKNNLPASLIAKCPAADQSSRDTQEIFIFMRLRPLSISIYQKNVQQGSQNCIFQILIQIRMMGYCFWKICILLNKFRKWMAVQL